uniref:Uncharacterized protein n=1 Tax=Castor canadensis TaxID=51338 RepID=A0A8C0X9N8_CASCN
MHSARRLSRSACRAATREKASTVRPLDSRASSKVTASSFSSRENRTEGLSFCARMGTHCSFISSPFLGQEGSRDSSLSVEGAIHFLRT